MVTIREAALWTDGRYHLQAEQQLDNNWILMRAGVPGTPSKEDWLGKVLETGSRVAVDAQTISHDAAVKLGDVLKKKNITLELLDENLVDLIWTDRPVRALQPIFHLPLSFSGRSVADKIASLRKHLSTNSYYAFLVTALDEVACTGM